MMGGLSVEIWKTYDGQSVKRNALGSLWSSMLTVTLGLPHDGGVFQCPALHLACVTFDSHTLTAFNELTKLI